MSTSPIGHSSITDSDDGGDVFDWHRNLVEAFDSLVYLTCDVGLALPVGGEWNKSLIRSFLLQALKIVDPLWLEHENDLDAMIELVSVASKGHQW